MTIELNITNALKGLVGGRCYADFSPTATLPRILFQQVGGTPINFYTGVADKRNGRFQINTMAASKAESVSLCRQADVILKTQLSAISLGEPISDYDAETKTFTHIQDFSIWFDA